MKIAKSYYGFRVTQRSNDEAVKFFVFVASARDILEWAMISRVEETKGGIQRRLSPSRAKAISRFFTSNKLNTTPTAIVLAFRPKAAKFSKSPIEANSNLPPYCEWGSISFSYDSDHSFDKPAVVVDGQHRLVGMSQVETEELPLLVSAILDSSNNELAFQFVVINNKASRVSADVVRSLVVEYDKTKLDKRLETARVSLKPEALLVKIIGDEKTSPLFKMINWPHQRGKGKPAVKPQAIEDSLKYMRGKYRQLDEDADALLDFFFAMWEGLKHAYPSLWANIDNHLFSNAGFKAISEYLTDLIDKDVLDGNIRLDDSDHISEFCKRIASQISIEFWKATWAKTGLDTGGGRDLIKEDLRMLRMNSRDDRSWSDNLLVIGNMTEDL